MEPVISTDLSRREGVPPLIINRDRLEEVTHVVDRQVNNPISETARLKREFHNILNGETNLAMNPTDISNSVTDSTATISELTDSTISELQEEYIMAWDRLSPEAITFLRRIAERMDSAGHFRDCVDVYKCVRKPFIDTHFRRLGIDSFSIGDPRRIPLEDFKRKIDLWIRAARVCIQILFKREKRLYDQIFQGIGIASVSIYETGFIATIKDAAVLLFKFADTLSSTPCHARKLFKILDFYNAISDLSSDIRDLFPVELSNSSIKIDTPQLLSRLKEVVQRTFSDIVNSLVHVAPNEECGGTIHSTTKFVMDYVTRILEHKRTLNQLIVLNPSTSFGDLVIPDMEFVAPRPGLTPLGLYLILFIVVLRFNLESKLKNFEDSSLATVTPDVNRTDQISPLIHLFMMNNVHYIVQHIRGSPGMKEIIGDQYLEKLSTKLNEEKSKGLGLITNWILYCLRNEGLRGSTCVSSGVSKNVVRERIKLFNVRLEYVRQCQPIWVVPDVQLREELRQSITTVLVPVYESFLEDYVENRRIANINNHSVEALRIFISTYFFS